MSVQGHDRITIEPDTMNGQPCIRGLRFPVVTVLRMLAGGMSVEDIIGDHPDLQPEDIPAVLSYAAEALAKAAADGLTLITADRGDFGRELALTPVVEPSVVARDDDPQC